MDYRKFFSAAQAGKGMRAGSITDISLTESLLIREIAYGFQEVVSPGRDVIFSFYVPENTARIDSLKLNLYFPGFQQGDYPSNSDILYVPCIDRACLEYKDGAFSIILAVDYEVGNSCAGGSYYWARLFSRFNISSLRGLKLKACELRWAIASKSFVGSGPNAQVPLRLHAINDYGALDKDDWGAAAQVDYGDVNVYTDTVGLVYSKDVKTRVQALIDAGENHAAFRFKATTENTDTANANSYHLNEPLLYCEIEEDTASKVGIYANDGPGFGDMLVSFSENKEEISLQEYFSGVGKKQIKLSALRSRRIEVLVRVGIKQMGGAA